MARPLRIERPGGRYHVTAGGNERKAVYREDSDRTHFLELLSEATKRLTLRVHASKDHPCLCLGRKWLDRDGIAHPPDPGQMPRHIFERASLFTPVDRSLEVKPPIASGHPNCFRWNRGEALNGIGSSRGEIGVVWLTEVGPLHPPRVSLN